MLNRVPRKVILASCATSHKNRFIFVCWTFLRKCFRRDKLRTTGSKALQTSTQPAFIYEKFALKISPQEFHQPKLRITIHFYWFWQKVHVKPRKLGQVKEGFCLVFTVRKLVSSRKMSACSSKHLPSSLSIEKMYNVCLQLTPAIIPFYWEKTELFRQSDRWQAVSKICNKPTVRLNEWVVKLGGKIRKIWKDENYITKKIVTPCFLNMICSNESFLFLVCFCFNELQQSLLNGQQQSSFDKLHPSLHHQAVYV